MLVTVLKEDVKYAMVKMWLKQAYTTFKSAKSVFVAFTIISTIIASIPLLGAFMLPLFTAKYAEAAAKIEQGETIAFSNFFHGLFARKSLNIIGVFHIIVYIIAMLVKFILTKSSSFHGSLGQNILGVVIIISVLFVIILLYLAFWIAPAACLFNQDLSASTALKLSVKAFLHNSGKILYLGLFVLIVSISVFVVFAITILLFHVHLTLIAIVPGVIGLIFLISWAATLHISSYFIYKSFFAISNG